MANGEVRAIESLVAAGDPAPAVTHPNTVRQIDHLVVQTPDVDRTVDALATAGLQTEKERQVPAAIAEVEKRTLITALAPIASACSVMRSTACSRDSCSNSV